MSERKASMGDKVYRGDVVKYIRNNISLDTFMKRTVQKADQSCWDLCDKLNFVPAIEEEQPERKRGHWIAVHGFCTPGGDPVWACSECGKGVHVYGIEHGTYGADVSDGQWKACPNCGAVMVGERND